jgi:CRISPR-associated protein Cas2
MVVVLLVERAPRGMRGELSRWLIEPRTGVFVGNISALVRDKLWTLVTREPPPVAGMLICGARNEQRFTIRTHGDPSREIVDFEGLLLVRIPTTAQHKRR